MYHTLFAVIFSITYIIRLALYHIFVVVDVDDEKEEVEEDGGNKCSVVGVVICLQYLEEGAVPHSH